MKKYKDIGVYDFSDYAEEITGDALFKINGGAQIENSVEAQANARVGDTLTRNDGTTVTITQGDIDWAKKQVGDSETTTASSTPTTETVASNSQSQQTSKSSVRTSSEYQGVSPQYWDALDEQKAKRQLEEIKSEKKEQINQEKQLKSMRQFSLGVRGSFVVGGGVYREKTNILTIGELVEAIYNTGAFFANTVYKYTGINKSISYIELDGQ